MTTRIARILKFLAGLPLLVAAGLIHAARNPRMAGEPAQDTAGEPAQEADTGTPPLRWWARPVSRRAKWLSLGGFLVVSAVWVAALWCLQLPFTAVGLLTTFAGLGVSLATREHNGWFSYTLSLVLGVGGIVATITSVTSGGEPGPIFPCWWPL